jgi:hypothetical protein
MDRENMKKALSKKFKEALAHIENRHPNIEIRNFDRSVFDKAISLVEDIVYLLKGICPSKKYKFYYRFVLPIKSGGFIVFKINLSITKEKFTHTFHALYISFYPEPKPSEKKKGALFVTLYTCDLECNKLELYNDFKNFAVRKKLYLHKGFWKGAGYGNPFPESYYSFEIPFDVEIVEYII